MGLFSRSQPLPNPSTITASYGGVVKGGNPAQPDTIWRRTEEWQNKVLAYADSVPEVAQAGNFIQYVTDKVKLTVEGMAGIENLFDGLDVGRACQNLFYVGEVYLAYRSGTEDGQVVVEWMVLGKDDIRMEGSSDQLLYRNDEGKFVPFESEWNTFRIFEPSPRDRHAAWSSHKSMLDLLEALYVHQLADSTVAISRLAGAGILYVPNDEMMQSVDEDGAEPEPGTQEHFQETIDKVMMDSFKNRDAQDAIVPLVMFGAAEYADGLRHVLMERPDDAAAYSARVEAYAKRYARSISIPEEIIMGVGTANHWGAYKVDQDTWQYCLDPLVKLLTEGIAKKVLATLGKNLTIAVDHSEVTGKPDRTDAGIRLYMAGAMSAEAALRAAGFDPETDISRVASEPMRPRSARDGLPQMPSLNFRDSDGEPIAPRNYQV